MKTQILTIIASVFCSLAIFSQDITTITSLENNYIKIQGNDVLGASVSVIYNNELKKVYQERTNILGVTTFVAFNNGKIVDKGIYNQSESKSKLFSYLLEYKP